MTARILVIGLDGATLDLIAPWVAQGKLPNFARVMRDGVHGPLRSVIPPISPPAWTTVMTGQNPGKHGIYDFVARRPDSYELRSSRPDLARMRTVFGVLSRAGKRVGVVNVPLTYPPEIVNGFMISGLKAPRRGGWTYPPELQGHLQSQGYWIDLRVPYRRGHNEGAYVQEVLDTVALRVRTAVMLMDEEDWDFFMVVFRATDDALMLWHLHDPSHPMHDPALAEQIGDGIEQVYRATDDALGRLFDRTGPDADVIIVSDHGGGPVHKEVYLNNWLSEHGWLRFRRQDGAAVDLKGLLRQLGLTRDAGWKLLSPRTLAQIKRMLPFLADWVPSSTTTLAEVVDWERTRAYSMGYIGQIYVNLQGREPQGIVPPGESYSLLVQDIEDALREWKDPDDGRPIVDAVYRRDELYRGPYVGLAPDLCLIMRGLSYITDLGREFASRSLLGPPLYTGTHRLDGVLMALGRSLRSGVKVQGASLADIMPTILYLLDVPVPTDLDGHVLRDMIRPTLLASRPVRYDSPADAISSQFMDSEWTDEDEQQMMDHLGDLGYLG